MKTILLFLTLLLVSYSGIGQTKVLNAPLNLRWGMSPKEAKDSLEKRNDMIFISEDTAEFGVIRQRYLGGNCEGHDVKETMVIFHSDSLYNIIMGIFGDKHQSELVEKLVEIYKQLKKKHKKPIGSDQIALIEKWRKTKTDNEIWDIIASYSDHLGATWIFGKNDDRIQCFIPANSAKILICYVNGRMSAKLEKLEEQSRNDDM